MDSKKKKKFPWIFFVVIMLCCQYIAAHVSGWFLEVGEWDIMKLDSLYDYFVEHPFDVTSFHVVCYLCVYVAGFALFFHSIFKLKPQTAEMKGMEHGSNSFMTPAEIREYVNQRMTPDFPYQRDCTKEAVYPKEVIARAKKKQKGRS